MRCNRGVLSSPKAAQGGSGPGIMSWGGIQPWAPPHTRSWTRNNDRDRGLFLYCFVRPNKHITMNAAACSLYGPHARAQGPTARPQQPWTADSPPISCPWTCVVWGGMGEATPKGTRGRRWHQERRESARRVAPRPFRQQSATGPTSSYYGPALVSRARQPELDRRLGVALQDHAAATR